MRVVVVAVGSRGDVVPFAALAGALAHAGHRVVLVTHAPLAGLAPTAHPDVTVVGVDSDPRVLLAGPAARALRRVDVRGLNRARDEFAGFLASVADPLDRVLTDDDAVDVVVASAFATAAVDVARRRGVPVVRAQLWPEHDDPHGPLPVLPYGWALPAPVRRAVRWALRRTEPLLAGFDGWWSRGRLHVRPRCQAGFTTSDLGVLHAYSSAVVGDDVPGPAHGAVVTGWWSPAAGGELSSRTASLLAAPGPPWVVAGFGSMTHGTDVGRLTRLLDDVARRCGVRVLLQLPGAPSPAVGGRAGGPDALTRPGVRVIGTEPHDALFAAVAAVVHHGGSGTTAAVVRAGVPSVVVPHVADQFYWAHRLHVAGAAPAPLPWGLLTASRLAGRLQVALAPAAGVRAARLGERVRREPGVAAAVEHLEAVIRP